MYENGNASWSVAVIVLKKKKKYIVCQPEKHKKLVYLIFFSIQFEYSFEEREV